MRKQQKFWLDADKPDEQTLIDACEDLKGRKMFAKVVRDGLRLMLDLRQGKTDVLHELFPWTKTA